MEPSDDLKGWWGEFTMAGYYPVISKMVSVSAFSYLGETHTEVYVVVGCNDTSYNTLADLSTASYVYVLLASGEFALYTGPYTAVSGTFYDIPITDEAGCQLLCSRTFKYGIYIRCTDGDLHGARIYHLYPEGSITRHTDTDGITVQIPSEGEYFDDAQNLSVTPGCKTATATMDTLFGNEHVSPTAIVMPNETTGATIAGTNLMQYHAFGGCPAAIELHYPSLVICDAPVGASIVTFTFLWF